jgi:hypothetical protein
MSQRWVPRKRTACTEVKTEVKLINSLSKTMLRQNRFYLFGENP